MCYRCSAIRTTDRPLTSYLVQPKQSLKSFLVTATLREKNLFATRMKTTLYGNWRERNISKTYNVPEIEGTGYTLRMLPIPVPYLELAA